MFTIHTSNVRVKHVIAEPNAAQDRGTCIQILYSTASLSVLLFAVISLWLHFTRCPLSVATRDVICREWDAEVAQHVAPVGEWQLEEQDHAAVEEDWKRQEKSCDKEAARRTEEESERQRRVLEGVPGTVVGFSVSPGLILLPTPSRFHVCATLVLARIIGAICVMVARATAPNAIGPGSVFPNVGTWGFSQGLSGSPMAAPLF